jgi:hypothetical protein|tara:strand:+ start:8751 stop:8978 length:228 start_codon:yes stop_codon:yes gene_type:complete
MKKKVKDVAWLRFIDLFSINLAMTGGILVIILMLLLSELIRAPLQESVVISMIVGVICASLLYVSVKAQMRRTLQ